MKKGEGWGERVMTGQERRGGGRRGKRDPGGGASAERKHGV